MSDDLSAAIEGAIPRLMRHVHTEGDCLVWTGGKCLDGYGTISVGGRSGRQMSVHRLAYEVARGPIPDGMVLDHLCRVRACVNPAHLEIVDNRTNVLRGIGPTARNAVKTECKYGHPFDELNTHIRPNGGRTCRACKRAEWHRRKRVAA